MSELKQCPFCPDGGEPVITPISGTTAIYGYRVWCRECLVEKNERTKEKVIAAWNQRAERTCKVEWKYIGGDVAAGYCECGMELDRCHDYEPAHLPNYCPNCGVRTVE